MSGLKNKKCLPCEGGVQKLKAAQVKVLLKKVPKWKVIAGKLKRDFEFKDFLKAMVFVNAMAKIAEKEQHHPDFEVHYNKVGVTIWTHAIHGLSENDFILAAKIGAAKINAL
jgi:4a-hydroxytetrahydrobiopterin dehydratase